MSQQTLFDEPVSPRGHTRRLKTETTGSLSRVKDSGRGRRLVSLTDRLTRAVDPLERAALAGEIRDIAESVFERSVRDANAGGLTWREIGGELGVPFQTLHRRCAAND